MIEQGMIFGLGFLAASLLSLLFLPVLSRRALRLASRRLSMLVPVSMNEIVAERDQIRAEHAVAIRRLEQQIEGLVEAKAEAMGDAGRQFGRVLVLSDEKAALTGQNTALSSEVERTTREAFEAQAAFGLQVQLLHDSLGLAERRLAILRGVEAQFAASEAALAQQQASVDAMEGRNLGQDLRIRRAMAQAAATGEQLVTARKQIADVTAEREAARQESALLLDKRNALLAELETEREKLRQAEQRFSEQSQTVASLASRMAEQGIDMARLQRDHAEAQQKVESLVAERAQAGPVATDDMKLLREAIVSIGSELLRAGERQMESAASPHAHEALPIGEGSLLAASLPATRSAARAEPVAPG